MEQESLSAYPGNRQDVRTNLPIHLNLYLLFSCYYPGDYAGALEALSRVVAFLQGMSVFTPANTPTLPAGVDKITLEFHNTDLATQQQLWASLGAKMMPAVMVKLRTVSVTNQQALPEIPAITAPAS
jgi:hypothetical protein